MNMTTYPTGYFSSPAFKASNRGYETQTEAEAAQKQQFHPWNWYVWQMNDGWWHISLLTNREP
jgi:hypothetical protein